MTHNSISSVPVAMRMSADLTVMVGVESGMTGVTVTKLSLFIIAKP